MKKLIAVMAALGALYGCSSEGDAMRALESSGYSEVVITGWKPLSCDEKDFFSTGFNAKNPNGKPVSGVVCSGLLFKNATVRF